MNTQHIDKIVLVVLKDNQILATLGKGQDNWQIPTTVPNDLETDTEALIRLAKEHLGAKLRPETVRHLQTFEAHAHAHGMNSDKTNKSEVRLKCYFGELEGAPEATEHIEKVDYLWFSEKHLLLQAYFGLLDELHDKGKLE